MVDNIDYDGADTMAGNPKFDFDSKTVSDNGMS